MGGMGEGAEEQRYWTLDILSILRAWLVNSYLKSLFILSPHDYVPGRLNEIILI